MIDDAMARPLGEVVDVQRWPRLLTQVAVAWSSSDAAEERLVQAVLEGVDLLDGLEGTVGDRFPQPVADGVRRLMARPYSPSRELVLGLLDQAPVRKLLREILHDAIVGFAKKARTAGESTPVGGLASGLGRFAKRRAGTFGSLAGDVVGAVGSEVEKQLERRASEFTDTALSGAIAGIADQLSDPARAQEQADLRIALLDGALQLTGPELAAELRRSDPQGLGRLGRDSLAGWFQGDGFEDQIRGWLSELVQAEGQRTLGETLDELDLRDTCIDPVRELLLEHARHLVATDAFMTWLNELEEP